jgi:hypothetical protein
LNQSYKNYLNPPIASLLDAGNVLINWLHWAAIVTLYSAKLWLLTHSAKSIKPFKKFDAHNRASKSTRHRQPHNAANMSSIDAIVNAGPSTQQLRENDDDPAEKFDALNVREDSEGWNDVEEDAEEFNVQCLFCSESATALAQALSHMKAQHEFDLVAFRARHGG